MSRNTGADDRAMNASANEEVDPQEVEYVDDDGEEEIVEEEVTDDEEEGESEAPSSPVKVESPAASRTADTPAKSKTPGKVTPSKKVKEMSIQSPETKSKRRSTKMTLSPDKNPFPVFGDWTPSTLSEIEICFPVLTSKNETTNDLTRKSKPEARYWKAPITFKYGNFTSDTIRVNNVHIPYHSGKGYGSSYVYLCLPGPLGEAFSEAGKRRAPTKIGENSLVPETARWWKIANNVEGAFGVINENTKRFHAKSLETIFDATSTGVSCSVVLSFKCKAATSETEALRPTTARTVSVEIVRGYINEVDINVQMPTRVNREKKKVEPVASSADVATDSLMKRLADLGL